ncbi:MULTISPECIES: hypothetical protein [unclassified Duganella]|uniref:hypothetical protein n=1 Tax=unclassified Duganella TaxID=2636909 RepID=UPI0008847866|nr:MULTISPECIES: hypothetical protein [unclassified Duganella]SDF58559.1 hypothetical protein SAMN05216320_101648 [Duganella sp. OV458]SDI70037.1 hypothetical protein SAMN05428973_101767 [Duganella sp. OV510]
MSNIVFHQEPRNGQKIVMAALAQLHLQDASARSLLQTSTASQLSAVSPVPVFVLNVDAAGRLNKDDIRPAGVRYQVLIKTRAVAQAYVETVHRFDGDVAVEHQMLQAGPFVDGFTNAIETAEAELNGDYSPVLLMVPEIHFQALGFLPQPSDAGVSDPRFLPVTPIPSGVESKFYPLDDLLDALMPIVREAIDSGNDY